MLTCTLALVPACTPKDGADSDPSTGAIATETGDAVTETGAETGATDTEPPATDTGVDDTTTTGPADSETAGDDTAGDDTVGDDTGDGTIGDDTGIVPSAECLEPDPTVSAAFAVDLATWPVEQDDYSLEKLPCTIDAVTSEGGTISTALTCEVEGETHSTTLDVAAAPEGEPAWAQGDAVILTLADFTQLGEASTRLIQMRAAGDDALLISGNDSQFDDAPYGRFQPLKLSLVYACPEDGDPFTVPMRVDFTSPDMSVVSIFHAHRGTVPISADELFAIDVAVARGGDIHPDEDVQILLRRVKLGE
jgi:hypothetical protein